MNMDEETGISIMKINEELDTGPIMMTEKLKITKNCNFEKLNQNLSLLGASTILKSLKHLENKTAQFIPQDSSKATYAKKINKSECKINWLDSAKKIIAKINALHPNPGAWLELNKSRIKIIQAKEITKSGKPGEILDDKFTIACSKNSIRILRLKKESKKVMDTSDFLRGNKLKIGNIINGV